MKMKRYKFTLLSVVLLISLTACSVMPNFSMLERLFTLVDNVDHIDETAQLSDDTATEEVLEDTVDGLAPYLSLEEAFIGVYEDVNPAVVHIRVIGQESMSINQVPEFQFPGIPELPNMPQGVISSQSIGSGFVIDKQGHIVTNNHVVSGAERIVVTFYDGTEVKAELIGTDPNADGSDKS